MNDLIKTTYSAWQKSMTSSDGSLDSALQPMDSLDLFTRMREAILARREAVKKIIDVHGSFSLYDYTKQKMNYKSPVPTARLEEVASVTHDEVARLFGEEIAAHAAEQIRNNPSVQTAQHFGPISHPRIINPTIMDALPYFDSTDPNNRSIIMFACAGISFNNPSFPRGYQFHSSSNWNVTEHQFVFFGRSVDPRPVQFYPAYGEDAVNQMKKHLYTLTNERIIGKHEGQALTQTVDEIFAAPNVMAAKTFVDQVTLTNASLWKKIFGKNAPELLLLSQENIVLKLIQKYHLKEKTLMHRMLFDRTFLDLLHKHFAGIQGAFDETTKYGTFLFWAFPKDSKYRLQMWYKDGKLTTTDGSYSIDLTPEAIGAAIERNELIPGLMLTYVLFAFYYGLQISGGLDQTTFLTEMKKKYSLILTELGETDEIKNFDSVPTDAMTITRPFLAMLKGPLGERIDATGADLLLYGNQDALKTLSDITKKIPFNDALNRILPDMYAYYFDKEEQEADLMTLTGREIEKLTGYDKKLPPLAILPQRVSL